MLRNTHQKGSKGFVKSVLVFFVELPMVFYSDLADLKEVGEDALLWWLVDLQQDE